MRVEREWNIDRLLTAVQIVFSACHTSGIEFSPILAFILHFPIKI